MISLIYNALLLLGDGLLLRAVARRPSGKGAVAGVATLGLGALILAAILGENIFGSFRLLSYALFLHGILLLCGLGALLRSSSRTGSFLSLVLAGLFTVVAVDAFLVEPTWLEVSQVTVRSPKIKRPARIALIADFQTDHIGDYELRVLNRVMAEKADLILLAGDYLQEEGPRVTPLREAFRTLLREVPLAAPLGVYAVRGNMDEPDWALAFEGLGVKTIERTERIDLGDVRLTSLSMKDSFNAALSVPPSESFHIVLGHSPDFALGQIHGDLLLAGHTHGGQIRIPGLGPVMTEAKIPRSWAAGVTALSGGRTLIVSRGVGMERGEAPRLRFLCRPELVLIDIAP